MRVERLVIEAGESTFTLDLHPRFTVVAGMGAVERESLMGELIGALGGSRPGVHLEVEDRTGRHLAVFRPTIGRHRVVDVDRVRDVTAEMAGPDGSCDLLGAIGLDPAQARRLMRFGSADLSTTTQRDQAVERLAAADQAQLWAAAVDLERAEGDLAIEASALGGGLEDADIIDRVEERHAAVERAAEQLEATRKRTFWAGGASGALTVPAVLAAGLPGLGLLAVAVLAVVASVHAQMRLNRAEHAEDRALAAAGANTYLGFQMQRVNSLFGEDAGRRALADAAEGRRTARARWEAMAGDTSATWALEHREQIEAAARLRAGASSLSTLSGTAPEVDESVADELVHALVTRLADARSVGGQGVPLLLDEPFSTLEPSLKLLLLELLGHSSGDPQIVLLTEDEDIASWARLESLTGELAIVEPAPEASHENLAEEPALSL